MQGSVQPDAACLWDLPFGSLAAKHLGGKERRLVIPRAGLLGVENHRHHLDYCIMNQTASRCWNYSKIEKDMPL